MRGLLLLASLSVLTAPALADDDRPASTRSFDRSDPLVKSPCKTDACLERHPSGFYIHPITSRRRR